MSKTIVITGAGIGLGRALARRFASDGERVVLLGRTFSKVQAAAHEIGERATAIACDVASPASVKAAFAEIARRHARIDVLINKVWNIDPEARMRFGKAALEAGIDLRQRPISQFTSVTQVFRSLIDLPADLHSVTVTLHARKPG